MNSLVFVRKQYNKEREKKNTWDRISDQLGFKITIKMCSSREQVTYGIERNYNKAPLL